MNGYLKLVHMEVHRFRYMLAGLMAFTAVFQLGALIWTLMLELSRRNAEALNNKLIQTNSALFFREKLSFVLAIFETQVWFIIPILLSIAMLVLYVFLIWYRDWIGRQTFIYRLLMLPIARRNIYLAKLTAILMFVFGLVSFQLVLLVVEYAIFNLIVPSDMREASYFVDAVTANQALKLLIPRNLDEFLFSYGLGVIAVLAIFTAILLERSYRRIGIVYAILYLAGCFAAIAFPVAALGLGNSGAYLYPNEIFAIELAMCAAVVVVSVWLGFRLLERKISV